MSSQRIRFGIVGTGTIAHRFAEAIKYVSNAELVAVASRTKENAEKFGNEFNIPLRFDSYEKMAQSDKIDAAYIAVPHSGHIECSCLMMNNGKHVLCEKPMAVNLREAKEMFGCAEKNNVLLMLKTPKCKTRVTHKVKLSNLHNYFYSNKPSPKIIDEHVM
jgi:predicted dehydrogenase